MKLFSLLLLSVALGSAPADDRCPKGAPLIVKADLPTYPLLARAALISGTVQVAVEVSEGEVVKATIVKSAGPLLDSPTLKNVRTWRFFREVNASFTTTFLYELLPQESAEPLNPVTELRLPEHVKISVTRTKPSCEDCEESLRRSR